MNNLSNERLHEIANVCHNGSPSMAEKKALASELGIESKKAKEIEKACYEAIREIRKSKTAFTKEDYLDFMRLHDGTPIPYNKFAVVMSTEPYAFVEFFKDFVFEHEIKGKPIERKINWGRLTCPADNYTSSKYNNAVRFLKENDPNTKTEREDTARIEKMLINKFNVLLADYKVYYLDLVKKHAKLVYEHNEKTLPFLKERAEKVYEEYKAIDCDRSVDRETKREKYFDYERVYNEYRKVRAFLVMFKTLDAYIEKRLSDAEKDFASNIIALTERVMRKELNYDKITVSNVKEDPKIFQMLITDGTTTLYARSIFCAQFSVLVSPHFRFIITEQ